MSSLHSSKHRQQEQHAIIAKCFQCLGVSQWSVEQRTKVVVCDERKHSVQNSSQSSLPNSCFGSCPGSFPSSRLSSRRPSSFPSSRPSSRRPSSRRPSSRRPSSRLSSIPSSHPSSIICERLRVGSNGGKQAVDVLSVWQGIPCVVHQASSSCIAANRARSWGVMHAS